MIDKKDKIIELAKKLKALCEKGVGGEKINAIERLKFIMEKYEISEEDIEGSFRKDFEFNLRNDIPYDFITQVLSSVIGRISNYGCELSSFKYVRKRGFKTYIFRNIEPELFSEFIIKVDMYWDDYNKQLELFYEAYVQSNCLYVKSDDSNPREYKELTSEERERLMKVSQMMQGIDRVKFRKQIE